ESVVDATTAVLVADARERMPGRLDAEPGEGRDRARHEPLAARLVDRRRPRLDDGDREAGHPRRDRGGEPDRTSAGDEDIDHGAAPVGAEGSAGPSEASARFSTGIRNPSSSTALSTVKARAVIQAVCTSGRAKPSITTAR